MAVFAEILPFLDNYCQIILLRFHLCLLLYCVVGMLQKNMLWWDISLSGIIYVPCNDVCLQGRRDSPMKLVKTSTAASVQLGSSATCFENSRQCFENQYSYLKLDLLSMLKEQCDTEMINYPSFPYVL